MLAGPGDDDTRRRRIGRGPSERAPQVGDHLLVQGIHRVRSIDRDRRDGVVNVGSHERQGEW
jgi:hypothetical protein